MEKIKTEIKICGKEYTVISSETPEYMQKIGDYVNQKMSDILSTNASLSGSAAAVLTAVNIADEFFKANDSAEHMRSLIGQYIEEDNRYKARIAELMEENERLKGNG